MIKLTRAGLTLTSVLLLTACTGGSQAASDITSTTPGFWAQFVYFFATMIDKLALGGLTGIGIILFTLILRLLLLPLYNVQIKASQKLQAVQPEVKAIQAKYPDKDMDSRMKVNEEIQALYKERGVNPFSSLFPLLIQFPILIGLYQALTRVAFLRTGHFLWFAIASPDPYFILPILAAGFTFLSTWLMSRANPNKDISTQLMTYLTPAMILLFSVQMASGVTLYWTVSNAFQVLQLLIFNNPFKAIAEREAAERALKAHEAKIRKAKRKASKRR